LKGVSACSSAVVLYFIYTHLFLARFAMLDISAAVWVEDILYMQQAEL
jgi:hypothetical protein